MAGTSISAPVDAAGQFKLTGVPPGLADLRFTAPGLSAALGLNDVQAGQTITIQVSLSGSSATLESDRRSSGREEQLEGRVESLPPTTPAGSLIVAGTTVVTDANTRFFLQGQTVSFASLALGQRVHVKGQTGSSGLLASVVDIQNTNTSTGLNYNGVISAFSGTPSAFQFTVNGQLVKGDSTTEFFGNSQFLDLADGARVEVKARQDTGFVFATRIHVDNEGVDFTGVIASKSGTSPELTLVVGTRTVKTSSGTEVQRKGDRQDVSVLYAGQTVTVSGRLRSDGVVVAWKIQIEQDAPGGTFEMEGSVGSFSGTCPTLSFSVSGYAIKTNASTVFTPSCAAISSSSKVLVKGTVQSDLSVLATSVAKQ